MFYNKHLNFIKKANITALTKFSKSNEVTNHNAM